jgi:hypothetical protein
MKKPGLDWINFLTLTKFQKKYYQHLYLQSNSFTIYKKYISYYSNNNYLIL